MTVNYAESYSRELANAYPYVLYSGALWSNENTKKYKVVDAKTIKYHFYLLEAELTEIELKLETSLKTSQMNGRLKHLLTIEFGKH